MTLTDSRPLGGVKRAVAAGRALADVLRDEGRTMGGNALRAGVRHPGDVAAELQEAVVQKWERTRPPHEYSVDEDWESRLHALVGAPWPCPDAAAFGQLHGDVVRSLTDRGIDVGPDAFVGWCDGDAALARAVRCIVLHRRPRDVVETGVARGITSRVVLEALERNGSGRLWSIDLPPQLRPQLNHEIGAAVPQDLRGRWRLIEGPSRRHLPRLLELLGGIDVFVHDSRHTTSNLRFELRQAWDHLRPGGVLLADDVDLNSGLPAFLAGVSGYQLLVAGGELPDPHRRYGRELFGIVVRA